MKISVQYFSSSGNTKKLAEAIAAAVGVSAGSVEQNKNEPADLLFLGGSVYAGNPDSHVQDFIQNIRPGSVKYAAIFGTAAAGKSIHPKVKEALEERGVTVLDEYFQCPGRFLLANRNRPNDQDCAGAAAFAQKIVQEISKE